MAMTIDEALERLPHLVSPARLAMADTMGRWQPVPHLMTIDRALVGAWRSPNSRTAIVVPFPTREEYVR